MARHITTLTAVQQAELKTLRAAYVTAQAAAQNAHAALQTALAAIVKTKSHRPVEVSDDGTSLIS